MPPSVKDRLQQKIKDKKDKEEKQNHLEQLKNVKIITDSISKKNIQFISVRFGDNVNLNFDRPTGKVASITDTKIVNTIPKEMDWLNLQDVLIKSNNNMNTNTNNINQKMYSSNEIGGILAVKPDEMLMDDYPDAVSFIIMEKINEADRVKINIIITLKIDDTYIKKNEIIDIIYSNINGFWVILKHHVGCCRLVYYYKPDYKALGIETESEEYSYTDAIINHTFICSLWTTFNISPSVLYIISYDENYQILILQFTVANYKSLFPEIILYDDINKVLYDKGQYLGFCVNNNISAFSVILKKSETEKAFYTGILALTNPDENKHTKIRLEFTDEHILNPNLNLLQCKQLIHKNMRETELFIIKCTLLENKEIDERKELFKKEKLAEENFRKILEEEAAEKAADKAAEEKQKIIDFNKKKKIEESIRIAKEAIEAKRILEEAESKRLIMYNDVNYIINYLLDNVMDKVTIPVPVPEIDSEIDTVIDTVIDNIMSKILDNIMSKTVKLFYYNIIKKKANECNTITTNEFTNTNTITTTTTTTNTDTIEPKQLILKKPILELQIQPNPESFDIQYVFRNNLYLLYPSIAYALENAPTKDIYISILINERDSIMIIIDNLVITHPYIIKIKNIIYNRISNKIDVTAIYGSYLSIIYSLVLNSIGFSFNPFSKYEKPLYEVDIDTMSISFLSDEDISYGYEFSCEKPTIIAYHTDIQPVQNTNIKISSIDTLLNNCWDINSTSAILLFEKNSAPHIMRNPDFTEFLFGIQPIKLIFGKNIYNLYNPELTEKRLMKARQKWY